MTTLVSKPEEEALLDLFIDEKAYGLGVQSLRSARILPVCPDPRLLVSSPQALGYCAHLLAQQFSCFQFDAVCAIATAAIPFAAVATTIAQVPLTYVFPIPRQARNTLRGSYELEGHVPQSARLLIIDDASGWGLTKLPVLQRLYTQGWQISGVLSVIDLRVPYHHWYAEHDIPCVALSSARALLERLFDRQLVSSALYRLAISWFEFQKEWTPETEEGHAFLSLLSSTGRNL